MPEFIIAQTEDDYREAGTLLREYEAALGIDLCFQNFPEELQSLERMYGPPGGRFLLLRVEERTAGCVALEDSGGKICEMKRLYVRPEFRGKGLGRKCAEEVVQIAREMGYAALRLHTLPSMRAAIALYRSMGFAEIAPYDETPVEGVLFMELGLG
ncbi:MAG: GNAT family N-acetyltransferase [Nitrospinae bacterium]|nr:GNAT family N-acetyltransferase [Nitrospinota bacterium]